jgi:hypothetical protein
MAALKGHLEVAEALLATGADTGVKNNVRGDTAPPFPELLHLRASLLRTG